MTSATITKVPFPSRKTSVASSVSLNPQHQPALRAEIWSSFWIFSSLFQPTARQTALLFFFTNISQHYLKLWQQQAEINNNQLNNKVDILPCISRRMKRISHGLKPSEHSRTRLKPRMLLPQVIFIQLAIDEKKVCEGSLTVTNPNGIIAPLCSCPRLHEASLWHNLAFNCLGFLAA